MGTLTSHLREPGDHGALAFHPGCPACREQRLLGTLSDRPLVSSGTQAALAAGVLAVSALGPAPAAIAADEPQSEQEGQVAPEDPGSPGESFNSPDFDPGGPDTELPLSVGPDDPEAESDVPEPLESEPVTDPGVLPEPPAGPGTTPEISPEPGVEVEPTTDVADPPPPAPAPVPEPPPASSADPLEAAPPAPAPPLADDEPSTPRAKKPARGGGEPSVRPQAERPSRSPEPAPPAEPPPAVTVPAEVVTVESEPSPGPVTPSVPAASRAQPGDRTHLVQSGESLWSIARDVLGRRASIARVAREVSRLWELNREWIGTGDPDLILSGTTLRLR